MNGIRPPGESGYYRVKFRNDGVWRVAEFYSHSDVWQITGSAYEHTSRSIAEIDYTPIDPEPSTGDEQ